MFKSAFRKRGTKPWDIYKSTTNDPKPELMVDYRNKLTRVQTP